MITFHIISIFPDAFSSYLKESILKRAVAKKLVKFDFVNPRRFATGTHKKVDDRPFGGGPGMVMKIEPLYAAVQFSKSKIFAKGGSASGGKNQKSKSKKTRIILFSTRGKLFTQADARRFAKYQHLIFICGRYEGVDERVAGHIADEELSIGDFILSGGELPALVVADAVARQIPGVLGKLESLEEKRGSYPVYTRPPVWKPKGARGKGWAVPPVLLSGDHKKIAEWRRKGVT